MNALQDLINDCQREKRAANLTLQQSERYKSLSEEEQFKLIVKCTAPVAVTMRLTKLGDVDPSTSEYLDPQGGVLQLRRDGANGFTIVGHKVGERTLGAALIGRIRPDLYPMKLYYVQQSGYRTAFMNSDGDMTLMRELNGALVVESYATFDQWCIDCAKSDS